MTRQEVELLIRMRSEADAALNKTAEGLRKVAADATAAGAGMDKVSASTQKAVPLVDQIDKIVDRFTKDTGEATRAAMAYAIAVGEIGGASKLTASQHAEVSRAVEKANSAYKAMGQEAPAHLRVLQRDMEGTTGKTTVLGGAMGSVKNIAAGMFAGFTVVGVLQGLQSAAVGSVDAASKMLDLSHQAGTSASALMSMVNAAALSGVGADALASHITTLTDALMSGDKSAVGGVKALGLSLDDVLKLSADERYNTIITALAGIGDTSTQTKLAFDVFGRGAKDALKLARDGFVENQSAAATWSDDQIKTLAALGTSWTRLKQDATSAIGSVMSAMVTAQQWKDRQVGDFFTWGDMLNPFTADRGTGLPSGPNTKPSSLPAVGGGPLGLPDEDEMARIIADLNAQAEAARKAGEAVAKLIDTRLDQRGYDDYVARLRAETQAYYDLAVMAAAAAQGLDSVRQSRASASLASLQAGLPDVVDGIPAALTGYRNQVSTPGINGAQIPFWPGASGSSTKVAGFSDLYGWNKMSGQLPGQLLSVFTGGGNKAEGLGALAGGMGGQAAGGLLTALAGSGFLSTGLATTLGLAGNILPIAGPIIGAFLGKAIGNMFGPSKNAIADREATGRIQTTQAGLIDRYGSVEQIAGMTRAGAELAAGWGHQGRGGEAAFNAQVKAFEESLQRQSSLKSELIDKERELASKEAERAALIESLVPRWDNVKSALDRYGISLDGAGIKVQQLGATETWTSMLNDIETLERAGVDVGGMLFGMKDEISKLVQESLRLGTEIPANMRPYVEELALSGNLVDANGKKITDLSNLKWGDKVATEADKTNARIDAMTVAIDEFKAAIDEIVTALRDLLPAAAGAGARGVQEEWDRNRPRLGYDVEGNRTDGSPSSTIDVPGAANGVLAGGAQGAKFRIFGEREPEMGGSVDFMARVMAKAAALTGNLFGGAGGGVRFEIVSVIDGKVAARALSGPLVRHLHEKKLLP